jgi:hypothetical protein
MAPRRSPIKPLAIDLSPVLNLTGALVKWVSRRSSFRPLALGYGEPVWPFLVPGVAAGVFGLAL